MLHVKNVEIKGLIYEEKFYMYITRKLFTCTLLGKCLHGFYEEIVYVSFTTKLFTQLYEEIFPRNFTTN